MTASGTGPFFYGSTIANTVRLSDMVTIGDSSGSGTLRATTSVGGSYSFVNPSDISLTLSFGALGGQWIGNLYNGSSPFSTTYTVDVPFTFGSPIDLNEYLYLRTTIYVHDVPGTFGGEMDFLNTASFSYAEPDDAAIAARLGLPEKHLARFIADLVKSLGSFGILSIV